MSEGQIEDAAKTNIFDSVAKNDVIDFATNLELHLKTFIN